MSETAFIIRAVAGAASRLGPVSVLMPGQRGIRTPDGLFDVEGIGETNLEWPARISPDSMVIVDEMTDATAALLVGAGVRLVFYLTGPGMKAGSHWLQLPVVVPPGENPRNRISPYVPVNPLASMHRHHGFGFTDYLLVLSGSSDSGQPLPALAAWLSAAFHRAFVVVVADAVAWAWRGRSLRGNATIDTRMDLWRLMAHASVCVDLSPGPLLARECIEALRLGTPVLTAEGVGPASEHARAGGGATFSDANGLIAQVSDWLDPDERQRASERGRRYADARFGDPARLVAEIANLHDSW